jgi:hypothetical protein
MAYLYKHIEVPTWAYFSPFSEVAPNTFQLNSDRMLYVGEAGVKAAHKIGPVPAGTLVVCDDYEIDEEQGYRRVYLFPELDEYVPAYVTEFLKANYFGVNEEWQLWLDWSGLDEWPPVEPEPEPIEPPIEPEPPVDELQELVKTLDLVHAVNLFGYKILICKTK